MFSVKKKPLHAGMEVQKEQEQGRDETTKMAEKRQEDYPTFVLRT